MFTRTTDTPHPSSGRGSLPWHEQASRCGFRVNAFFFDADAAQANDDFVERNLPVLRAARPRVLCTEQDRRNFVCGELIGQPDAVLEHGEGLIVLEYKSCGGWRHPRYNWDKRLPIRAMLQCLAGAMAVSGELQRPALPVLRLHNVVLQLIPDAQLVAWMADSVPAAKAFHGEMRRVSISQLASFAEDRVREMFEAPATESARERRLREGAERHAHMLRPNNHSSSVRH